MRWAIVPGIFWRAGIAPLLTFAAACALFGRIGPSLAEDMDGHRAQVDRMEEALVFGELEAARASARWLATHPDHPDLPRGILGPTEDIRAFARSLLRSDTADDATRFAAEIAAACGRCHGLAGVEPSAAPTAAPEVGPGLAAHMDRRLRALDLMWDALIAADDERWASGASALDESSRVEDAVRDSLAPSLARRLRAQAAEAPGVAPTRRAEVFGRILSTCAACHTALGARPRAPRR